MPFTREQFFDVFVTYNQRVWPAQILLLALAVAMVVAIRFQKAPRGVAWALAGLWAWMGIAYHILFFMSINPMAFIFGAAFIMQAALIVSAARTHRLAFGSPQSAAGLVIGALLVGYALLGYPLVAFAVGQRYPAMPTFGLPCPTTIFTFGLLAWTVRRPPWSVIVIPVGWAAIGTSAGAGLDIPEDWGLPVAAVALVVLGVLRQHRSAFNSPAVAGVK